MPQLLKTWLRASALGALLLSGGVSAATVPNTASDTLKPPAGGVTYVDFWASWCAPCAESFPWLNEMQARYGKQGLRVVGVGLDTQVAKGDRFLKAHPAQFTTARDPEGKLAEQYGVEGMPYAVLIDAEGHVLHRHVGFRAGDAADYEQAIQQALRAGGSHP